MKHNIHTDCMTELFLFPVILIWQLGFVMEVCWQTVALYAGAFVVQVRCHML